ncbi:MAG: dethiobiotin synthase [Bdellovibrionota bacterium]
MSGIFITGTDTNIGKTTVSAILCSALRQHKANGGYFKPVQTGPDDDAATVQRFSGIGSENILGSVYSFPESISPHRAAEEYQQKIQLPKIYSAWSNRPKKSWIVEGAGGLLVPLASNTTMRDLARALDLPLLVVASTRLGTINHTLLTIEAARATQLRIVGIVLNGSSDSGLAQTLETFSGTSVLAEVPNIEDLNADRIAATALEIFPINILNRIFDGCLNVE